MTEIPKLVVEPFFVAEHNEEWQEEYRIRAETRRAALIDAYPSYRPAIHDQILLSMIRSEIMAEQYERKIANAVIGEELKTSRDSLAIERKNIEKCGQKLMTDLKSVKSQGASDIPDDNIMAFAAQVDFAEDKEEDFEDEEE